MGGGDVDSKSAETAYNLMSLISSGARIAILLKGIGCLSSGQEECPSVSRSVTEQRDSSWLRETGCESGHGGIRRLRRTPS